jgi:hypothetical protein
LLPYYSLNYQKKKDRDFGGSSLLTLLDDIATLLDDISVMGKLAAKKPRVCWVMICRLMRSRSVFAQTGNYRLCGVAKGSFLNKVIPGPAGIADQCVHSLGDYAFADGWGRFCALKAWKKYAYLASRKEKKRPRRSATTGGTCSTRSKNV